MRQYRLAHHLQKVYLRLKDYTPQPEYQNRLVQITKAVVDPPEARGEREQGTGPQDPLQQDWGIYWRGRAVRVQTADESAAGAL